MSSIRVPVLCAFGVGCLSSAVLLGFGRADDHAETQASKRARSVEDATVLVVTPNVERRTVDDSPRNAVRAEPARDETSEHEREAKNEPAPAKDVTDAANASPLPGGSAVSDVLMDLEAAYRQRLIAAARAEAAARDEADAVSNRVTPPAEPPREVAVKAVAPAPVAVAAVAPAPAAIAPAVPAAPAPARVAPEVPAPTAVAQNDARPVDVHIGDVNRNTYVTNVRQGDVYVIQQQLAMLNYMQLAGMGANPYAVQPHVARGVVPHQAPQNQFKQFPSTLTNLDNPWGFNFAPPNLVH